jgi:uncharacterized protein (DUF1778 family)
MARTARKNRTEGSTARMELRISPSTKEFIRRAMAVSGRSAAELAYEGARRVLEEHERMVLAGRDREAFLAAVRNPPLPTEHLKKALRRHDKLSK